MGETTDAEIIMGIESWLTEEYNSSEIFPRGYQVFSKGEGIFIIVKETLDASEPEEITTSPNCNLLWLQISNKVAKDLYFGFMYRPPSNDDSEYLGQFDICLTRIPVMAHIWLGGDYNLPAIDLENGITKPRASQPPTRVSSFFKSLP